MYKTVIFSNDFKIVKKICNVVLNKFNNIQLIGIVYDYNELLEIYSNSEIDMIIISDSNIQNIKIQHLLKNIDLKVVFFKNDNNSRNSKHQLYLPINESSTYLINQFKNFISKTDNINIRKKVFNILKNLNFDFKLIGTNYLLDAIIYSYMNKNDYHFENLEKQIYPYIAKLHNASNNNIKWSIIRSVNNMNTHLNSSTIKEPYIKFCDKVTPKLLITEIVNRI